MPFQNEETCRKQWGGDVCGGCGKFWYECDCAETFNVAIALRTARDEAKRDADKAFETGCNLMGNYFMGKRDAYKIALKMLGHES